MSDLEKSKLIDESDRISLLSAIVRSMRKNVRLPVTLFGLGFVILHFGFLISALSQLDSLPDRPLSSQPWFTSYPSVCLGLYGERSARVDWLFYCSFMIFTGVLMVVGGWRRWSLMFMPWLGITIYFLASYGIQLGILIDRWTNDSLEDEDSRVFDAETSVGFRFLFLASQLMIYVYQLLLLYVSLLVIQIPQQTEVVEQPEVRPLKFSPSKSLEIPKDWL